MRFDRIIAVIDGIEPHLDWIVPVAVSVALVTWLLWPSDVVPSHWCGICGGASPGYGSPR